MQGETMKEPVVIADSIFAKTESFFNQDKQLRWLPTAVDEPALAEAVRTAEARIAVLSTTPYTGELYQALSLGAPALIARFGVGYDSLDLEQCRERDIAVTITPGALDQSVAEHTLALLLGAARHIPHLDQEMRNGSFTRETGFELRERTLGIAGFGHIGKRVALIAVQGFGMKISAFDSLSLIEQCTAAQCTEVEFLKKYGIKSYHTEFEPFARTTDILSIHLPLDDNTRCFFNRERLETLNRGAILINTGRGSLIDEAALYTVLARGHLRLAALDVFTHEPYQPVRKEMDLRGLPNVILSPHSASNTLEANRNMAERVLHNIHAFLDHNTEEMNRVI
jgi:phosphoglycerate dehydrogenase-like enzyme